MIERAKATAIADEFDSMKITAFDFCEGYCEKCITSHAFPSFCPINDFSTAICMHLERGDDVNPA